MLFAALLSPLSHLSYARPAHPRDTPFFFTNLLHVYLAHVLAVPNNYYRLSIRKCGDPSVFYLGTACQLGLQA
jgi:hypothetical protein